MKSMANFLQAIDVAAREKIWDQKRVEKLAKMLEEVVPVVQEVQLVVEAVREKKVEVEVVDSLVGSKFEMIEEPVVGIEAVQPVAMEQPVVAKARKSKRREI